MLFTFVFDLIIFVIIIGGNSQLTKIKMTAESVTEKQSLSCQTNLWKEAFRRLQFNPTFQQFQQSAEQS